MSNSAMTFLGIHFYTRRSRLRARLVAVIRGGPRLLAFGLVRFNQGQSAETRISIDFLPKYCIMQLSARRPDPVPVAFFAKTRN